MILFGKKYSKKELLKRVGDISQIGGIKAVSLADGNEYGVSALEFKTGTGFHFTVLPGRGMDISNADYNGKSLCWRSCTGDVHSAYFEPEKFGWLKGFFGGLLTTCGITYAGHPCVDEGKELGLHGRVSGIPAKNIYYDGKWEKDEYIMFATGKIRETSVFGENIMLTRTISAKLSESKIYLHDVIENLGFEKTPHMILYHINGGFPVIDKDSIFVSPSLKAEPRDDEAKNKAKDYYKFQAPTHGFKEKVYFHDMQTDKNGFVYTGLINKSFNNAEGFGFYIKYRKKELPFFVEWKMTGEGIYVVGIEPANCFLSNRAKLRSEGKLPFLNPGEKKEYSIEIVVLSNSKEIKEFENIVRRI